MPYVYAWAGDSDTGLVRENNEDALYPSGPGAGPGPQVFAVADGLGGLDAGEVASRVAVQAATRPPPGGWVSVTDRMRAAERAVVHFVEADDTVAQSATTLTLAELTADGRLNVAHCGDSRLYLFAGHSLVQVSTDQTVTQRKLERGEITRPEARRDPERHILISALGVPDPTVQHVAGIELDPGDRILLCSDGLTEMVEDDTIARIIGWGGTPEATVKALIDSANEAGGRDNITVIVVEVTTAEQVGNRPDLRRGPGGGPF